MLLEGKGKTCLRLYILARAVVAPSTASHLGLVFGLDCTCSLGLCIFKDYAQVCVFGATTASFLLHCCHPCSPFGCIIFYTCTGVIVRGVDAPASAKVTSVNLCWVWATPSSLLIWPGLVAMVSVFCHNVSSPCCRTLWMKSFIFLFISGL